MTEAEVTGESALIARGRPRGWSKGIVAELRGALTPHSWAILVVLGLMLVFYMWTAATSIPFDFNAHDTDIYNELTTGFLHGHLYLPIQPPAGLLHLKDPYDPVQNAPYQAAFHDLSLYHGHFYSQWGPAPAIALFLPFRLTGLQMSASFAVALFAFIGLACAVALLHLLVRRLVPRTPNWLLVISTVGLSLSNVAPFLLRRPAHYEVAISGAYCFEMAGLLLFGRAVLVDSPRRRLQLGFGSLCLGLALGSRPTMAGGIVVAALAGAYLIRRRDASRSALAYALGPVLLCALLVGLYNHARFGSFTDVGARYELSGVNSFTHPIEQLAYVPPGLFSYLLIPAKLTLAFPHAMLMTVAKYPFPLPAGYATTPSGGAPEPAGGILMTIPITLLLLLGPWLWRKRRREDRGPLLIAAGMTCYALAIVTLTAFALWGTTQRYEVDFATLFVIPALLIWALLIDRSAARRRLRRALTAVGIALIAFGSLVGVAVSLTGYYDALLQTHPKLFKSLEDITAPLATLVTNVVGHAVLVRVDGPLPTVVPTQHYTTLGLEDPGVWVYKTVTITVISPSSDHISLSAVAGIGPGAPPDWHPAIEVRSPGGAPVTVPILGVSLRMPITLHSGLNRIELTLPSPTGASPEELYLGHISLSR